MARNVGQVNNLSASEESNTRHVDQLPDPPFDRHLSSLIECVVVTAVQDQRVHVKRVRNQACLKCAQGQGCGGGVIAYVLGKSDYELVLPQPSDLPVRPGQRLEVSLPINIVLKLAALMYLAPLAAIFSGALLFYYAFGSQVASVLGAACALLLCISVLRAFGSRVNMRWITEHIRMESS